VEWGDASGNDYKTIQPGRGWGGRNEKPKKDVEPCEQYLGRRKSLGANKSVSSHGTIWGGIVWCKLRHVPPTINIDESNKNWKKAKKKNEAMTIHYMAEKGPYTKSYASQIC